MSFPASSSSNPLCLLSPLPYIPSKMCLRKSFDPRPGKYLRATYFLTYAQANSIGWDLSQTVWDSKNNLSSPLAKHTHDFGFTQVWVILFDVFVYYIRKPFSFRAASAFVTSPVIILDNVVDVVSLPHCAKELNKRHHFRDT